MDPKNQKNNPVNRKDEEFLKNLQSNLDEIKDVDTAGMRVQEDLTEQAPISEEEAKRLILEDKRRTERSLKESGQKGKKIMIAVVIVAAFLCAFGVVFAMIVGGQKNDAEDGVEQSDNDVSAGEEEKPDEPENNDPVQMAVSDALVQKLYHNFDVTNGMVYVDEGVLNGDFSALALGVAALNTEKKSCKKVPTEEILEERYGDLLEQVNVAELLEDSKMCFGAEEVTKKAQEIFGKTLSLEDGAWFGSFTADGQPRYKYDAENGEFYYALALGDGGVMPKVAHNLERAERQGNYVYLYDVVGQVEECYIDNTRKTCAGPIGVSMWNYDLGGYDPKYVVNYELTDGNILNHADDFSRYKWTFSKNIDGNYVLKKLEKLEG